MQMYTNCYTPDSGYVNQDGYVRVLPALRRLGGKLKMRHRVMWQLAGRTIPKDKELHHKCRNRACCNLDHLELIGVSEHKSLTNSYRYKDRAQKVLAYYKSNEQMTYVELARQFNITPTGARAIVKRNY